jgi:hypothetical protein
MKERRVSYAHGVKGKGDTDIIRRCPMGLEDVFEDSLPGFVIGALASAILIPLVGVRGASPAQAGTAGRRRANPLMKAAVRGYVSVTDRVREYATETREQLQDLAAEVRAERRKQAEEAAAEEAPGAAPASDQAKG